MDKAEVKQIADFLNDVHGGLCEGDEEATIRLHLTELYRIIRRLMDATFATQDQGLKVLLATMEKRAREYKQEIEGRLGVRNQGGAGKVRYKASFFRQVSLATREA